MVSEKAVSTTWSNEDLLRKLAEGEREKTPTVVPPGTTLVDCNLYGTFYDQHIDFSGVTFQGATRMDNVGFRGGVFFVGAEFMGTADFGTSRFAHFADFANATFHDTVSFFRITVEPRLPHIPNTHNPGEATFSYCRFFEDANFERAKFGGPAYFHRASFLRHADFTEVRFEKEALFNGWENDVAVPKNLIPTTCRRYLYQLGLAQNSAYNGDNYLNFDPRLGSEEELREALAARGAIRRRVPDPATARRAFSEFVRRLSPIPYQAPRPVAADGRVSPADPAGSDPTDSTFSPLSSDEIDLVVDLYKTRRETPLFSSTCEVSFRHMVALENVTFSSCSLRLCRLEGATVEKLRFSYVKWDERRAAWKASPRDAVRDEEPGYEKLSFQAHETGRLRSGGAERTFVNEPRSLEAYDSLKKLYRGLRRHAEDEGEFDQAQDFYFGEMEMLYRSRPRPVRWTSWEFFYRYLSGFGKQDKLAAFWLILMVGLLFPFFYYITELNITHHPHDWKTTLVYIESAEAHSLEASTLLSTKGRELGRTGDLINDLERALVPLQAGLLLLAIRYNFQHKAGK